MSDLSELIADVKEQVLYLQELGVDSFEAELPSLELSVSPPRPAKNAVHSSLDKEGSFVVAPRDRRETETPSSSNVSGTESRPPGSRLASLPSLSKRMPNPRPAVPLVQKAEISKLAAAHESLSGDIAPTLGETADTIESIRAEIGDCTRCALYAGRKQIVHSTGNFNAELMFVGEAPGADENEQGFPFVGRAGQLLTKIIESIGMSRDEVFIGNINRCRPPGNRAPEPDETAACRPFILREVAVIKPKVIVVLGATAAHNLLQVKTPISKLRGNFHEYFGVKVMPTFHPAYLLRDPHKKREVWEDMKMVRELLNKIDTVS